jgi:hypothetical protein
VTQVQLPKIRRKVLGDQLETRLRQIPGTPVVAVHRGEVPGQPDLAVQLVGGAPDPAGRIAPYVVLFDGTGTTDLEVGRGRCGEQLRWTPQVTVAAGFAPDCAHTVDRVMAWLKDWRPVIPEVATGFLLLPPGYDPGPARPDRQTKPPRWFVPLQFQLDATT